MTLLRFYEKYDSLSKIYQEIYLGYENKKQEKEALIITKNIRSHALNATKKRQNLNLQVYRLEDGTKVRLSAKEIRTLAKNEKAA